MKYSRGRFEISSADYVWTAKETISYAYDLDAEFEPGEYYKYSNTNYILLELIIEKVTGNSFAKELRFAHLQNPQSRADFCRRKRNDRWGKLPRVMQRSTKTIAPDEMTDYNNAYGLADCGIVSNIYDLATFLEALFLKEELLDAESLDEMLDWYETKDDSCYGLGINSWWDSDWGRDLVARGTRGRFLFNRLVLTQ